MFVSSGYLDKVQLIAGLKQQKCIPLQFYIV